MKRLIAFVFFAALYLFNSEAVAAIRYAEPSGGISTGDCTDAGDPCTFTYAKTQIVGGVDTLRLKGGTYNEEIGYIPSGTSANARTIIESAPGETAILRHLVVGLRSWHHYRNFTVDANNSESLSTVCIMALDSGPGHRFENLEIKNCPAEGILGDGHYTEFVNLNIHDGGYGTSCLNNEPYTCHGIYYSGDYLLVERVTVYGFSGLGFQLYRNMRYSIVRNNLAYNNGTWGFLISWAPEGDKPPPSQNLIYNNISHSNGYSGFYIGSCSYCLVYNNTTWNNGVYGMHYAGANSNTIGKNNLSIANADGNEFNECGAGCTLSNNINTGTAASHFVNAPGGNFNLISTSTAIDAGAISIGSVPAPLNTTFSAVYNGSLPDIGAHETIPFSSGSATDTSTVDITFGAAFAPLSTIASCSGWTLRQASATKTLTTCSRQGNATYRLTCSACLSSGGGQIDFSVTSNVFTDSAAIGGTLNQGVFTINNQGVNNNIGGTVEVFTSRHFRQRAYAHTVSDNTAPAWIAGEDRIGVVRVDGGRFSNLWQIDCTVANCPSVAFLFEFNLNGGSYANVTDSCATNAACFDSTNSAAPHGTTINSCLLTEGFGNCLPGSVAATGSSYPVLDLAANQTAPIQGNFTIKSGLSVGDRICIRPKLDSGAAISHAVTACFDVVNPSAGPS